MRVKGLIGPQPSLFAPAVAKFRRGSGAADYKQHRCLIGDSKLTRRSAEAICCRVLDKGQFSHSADMYLLPCKKGWSRTAGREVGSCFRLVSAYFRPLRDLEAGRE
jgi:hypothetical protein